MKLRSRGIWLNRIVYWLSRYWILAISFLVAIYVGLPWLAPLFMEIGWVRAGSTIYSLYATQCHQLPQRSFFLFGSQPMYSLTEIQDTWQYTNDPLVLRQFVGEASVGWKVAWSDRMVFMYTSILLWGALLCMWRWMESLPGSLPSQMPSDHQHGHDSPTKRAGN